MKSYILKPKSVKISQIKDVNSFSIKDFLKIRTAQGNLLKSFLKKSYINSNIESGYYYKKSNYFLVGNRALNDNILLNENEFIGVTPKGFETKSKCVIEKGDILIGNNGTLGQIGFIKNNFNGITNSNVTLLRFNSLKPIYYFIGFFYTSYFKNYCSVISTKSGTQEFITRDALENIVIPFPSKNNHENPENIEKLVSLITQNIINKEEQIKLKNAKIDELIEKELLENQKVNNFTYNFPRISEIKSETRLDTGLYEKEYKSLKKLIENYENGSYNLLDKYNENRGQNLQVSQIGLSIYSNEYKNNFYRLLTNTELTDYRTISTFRYLGSKEKLSLVPKNSVILSADGTIGRSVFIDDLGNTTTNIHPWILIKKENNNDNIFESIFLSCFLSYLKDKDFYEKIKDKANGGGIKQNHLQRYIKIPNFPEEKQQEIAMQYYNKIDKNSDLNLDNYLQKEFERNSQLGIFQLNMELFELKEKLEDIIDKIIMDEKIEIDFL